MSRKRGTYESIVSAKSESEAIDIALEALPKGSRAADTQIISAEADHGPNSWQVTVKFVRRDLEGDY